MFSCHSFAVHERVPNGLLIVIALVAPMVLMPLVNLLTVRSLWDWHNSSLGGKGLPPRGGLTLTPGVPNVDNVPCSIPGAGFNGIDHRRGEDLCGTTATG